VLRVPAWGSVCYKSRSHSKLLILNEFLKRCFCRQPSQALDFAGLWRFAWLSINKVIHNFFESRPKCFAINDLSTVSEMNLNFGG